MWAILLNISIQAFAWTGLIVTERASPIEQSHSGFYLGLPDCTEGAKGRGCASAEVASENWPVSLKFLGASLGLILRKWIFLKLGMTSRVDTMGHD